MFLESYLTTIPTADDYPTKVADLGFRPGTRVTIPYLDSRSCSGITLDMHEPIVRELFEFDVDGIAIRDKTLALALKVYYRNRILFHGPLSSPKFDYTTGKVELAAHDPSLRLKRAFVNSTDTALLAGLSMDGEGLMKLLDAAQNTTAQDALGWPALGIIRGKDTTSDYSDKTTALTKGDNIWDSIKQLADALIGPDFDLEPIETDPAELATGADTWSTGATITDGATTDVSIVVSRGGNIGNLSLGIYATHNAPQDMRIDLIHPDGTTVRVYTGSRDKAASGSAWLGSSSSDLTTFIPGAGSIYDAAESYPHVGSFRGDRSLAAFTGKVAAGTWKVRFIDTATNGSTGSAQHIRLGFSILAPAYCRMNATDKPDTAALTNDIDPEGIAGPSCVFHKGHGKDNAKTFAVTSQGEMVVNQFIAAAKGRRKIRVDDDSRAAYGTYQGYESPNLEASDDYLQNYADAQVGAYSRPLSSIELAPADDGGLNDTLRWGDDFRVGGHVLAIGKRGYAYHSVLGRVTQAVLTQTQSSVATDLDVQPAIAGVGADDA